MDTLNEYIRHATALRADVLAAPAVWLPRREILLDWLNGFLSRAQAPDYDLGETEADDLAALEKFLRKKSVPVAKIAA